MFAEPDILENGLAIDVNFKFFVYDYIQKNFLVFECTFVIFVLHPRASKLASCQSLGTILLYLMI